MQWPGATTINMTSSLLIDVFQLYNIHMKSFERNLTKDLDVFRSSLYNSQIKLKISIEKEYKREVMFYTLITINQT